MSKIVLTYQLASDGMKLLEQHTKDYVIVDSQDPEVIANAVLDDTEALIVRMGTIDRHVIEKSKNLKVISRIGVGFDNVDIKTANELGIPVILTPGANSRSVAEHTLMLMLAMTKNLVNALRETENGNYNKIRMSNKHFEFKNAVVGILGFGNIGREVASMCRGIGMKVIVYDPYFSADVVQNEGFTYVSTVDEVLKDADILTIHIPLNEQTRNIIAMRELKMMKKTSIIINCARGGLINETDLCNALNDEIISGAAVDVTEKEPLEAGDPIFNTKNLIITPHMAGTTDTSFHNMAAMCIDSTWKVLNGEKVKNVANPAAYNHKRWNQINKESGS